MLIVAQGSAGPCFPSPSFDLNSGRVSIRGPRAGEVVGLAGSGIGAHQQAGFVDIALAREAGAGEIRIAKEGKGLEHSARRWRARQGPKGGIEEHQRHLGCNQGCGFQSAPRRHGRMQLLRTTGCSEQEGDGEAHQGQSGQTGGGKNREGLDQRQLQHRQNLEQSLRTAIIPACYRCNRSWQGRSGERQLSVRRGPAWLCWQCGLG